MQEQEYTILEALKELDSPSQRQLAEETDLSLGKVNAIIKRLVSRGLLQVERLNTRHFKYILTPGGLKELTTRSLNYIKKSYQAVQQLSKVIRAHALKAREAGWQLYLYGPDDEIGELAQNILSEEGIDYTRPAEIAEITGGEYATVLYWLPDDHIQLLEQFGDFETVNLVNVLRLE
ncbi:winged helix-turn-helix transcriptional regulator [Halanaerobiaceae bacterium Z-7014]|uniref:Winged helix-turn-helix transcriptional regulator n=1 Tax=Halonatronomonas betaini TaxID=2778430 RepID=A0A931APD8_9FIRM|nr:winged helix-turn-helix transcriptional regulator [Halonatronomonas betaini]MBF8436518.1 winged helix-turn-helix transcriptional regulator [Halonatronomonas betaini]